MNTKYRGTPLMSFLFKMRNNSTSINDVFFLPALGVVGVSGASPPIFLFSNSSWYLIWNNIMHEDKDQTRMSFFYGHCVQFFIHQGAPACSAAWLFVQKGGADWCSSSQGSGSCLTLRGNDISEAGSTVSSELHSLHTRQQVKAETATMFQRSRVNWKCRRKEGGSKPQSNW